MVEPKTSRKRKYADDDDAARRKAKKVRKLEEKRARRGAKHAYEFTRVEASLLLALPPVFAAAPAQGVEEMLDSMLMRYIPPLRGVVLAHENAHFLDNAAEITGDSPFARCRVAFSATVWSPRVGQRLTGHITVSSPDHVALLVHRTFNAAIPAAHLPRNEWEFIPSSSDAEGVNVNIADTDTEAILQDTLQDPADDGATSHARSGHWVHAHTRTPLGGSHRMLTFTVVGMTIANQMLSVVGSILPDPFASTHVSPSQDAQEREPLLPPPQNEPESDLEPDFDVFAALGRSTDTMTRPKDRKRSKDKGASDSEKRHKKSKKDKTERKTKAKAEMES